MSGEKIRIARIIKGYSQEYMAFMLDISQSTFSKMESGGIEITVKRLFEIAEILEVKIIELLPDSKMGNFLDLNGVHKIYLKLKLWFRKLRYKKTKNN
ncbi:MAG: helix-turn-helix transcriptional regulator [Burkholderiales bacterium]|nr:helix-turn-helix transcriptional regulator [Bacteroidia bacterium]